MTSGGTESFLHSLIRTCLSRRCRPDALIRRGQEERLPSGMRLPVSADAVFAAARGRFWRLMRDMCDYGQRRDYNIDSHADQPSGSPAPGACQSLGACTQAACEAFVQGWVDEAIVRWLSIDMGYNMDWLLFGLGNFCRLPPDNAMPPSGSKVDPETGRVTLEDVSSVRERQEASLWNFTDWQWLLNLRAIVRSVYRQPTIPLLTRVTAGLRVPTQMPHMPHILHWIDWLAEFCAKEFVSGEPVKDWRQNIVAELAVPGGAALLLLGVGGQSLSQYRGAKSEPSANVLRLAWIVRMIAERWGREGFLLFLNLVDDEARARGMRGLREVFARRAWGVGDDAPKRAQKQTAGEVADAREMAYRSVPWGVPAEADLSPAELLDLVASGNIPVDPEEDVAWIPEQSASPRVIRINP